MIKQPPAGCEGRMLLAEDDPQVEEASADQDDTLLIQRALHNPADFAALYQRYLARVYRFVSAHCASPGEADDLTQQVFTQALRALPTFAGHGAFVAWLFRIARNAIIDAQRRQRPSVSWEHLPEQLHPRSTCTPEELVLREEALIQLRTLLKRLDPPQRELLALRFGAQLRIAEIAEVLGKRPDAVKKQITRLLHTLKEQFHDD